MKLNIQKTPFSDLYLLSYQGFSDQRGWFSRVYCKEAYSKAGIDFIPVQINRSCSKIKGTIRGLHFQKNPSEEDKLIQCVKGKIFDVAVDLRPKSLTYRQFFSVSLSAEERTLILIPKGFAHGFQALEDDVEILYMVSQFYAPTDESGIRCDDPALQIHWPLPVTEISEKDKSWPLLS
jgi:dTDP-4-dehydrorhamnose 3,5-epimerase